MEEGHNCEKCKYWVEAGGTDDGLVGECHRSAPLPDLIDASSPANLRYAVWPATADKDWCGDYAERPMATQEVLARLAAIQKLEAERKSKAK